MAAAFRWLFISILRAVNSIFLVGGVQLVRETTETSLGCAGPSSAQAQCIETIIFCELDHFWAALWTKIFFPTQNRNVENGVIVKSQRSWGDVHISLGRRKRPQLKWDRRKTYKCRHSPHFQTPICSCWIILVNLSPNLPAQSNSIPARAEG